MADIDLPGLILTDRRHTVAIGNAEDGPGLHPVNVVAEEGIRVAAIQRDQHLFERDLLRLGLAGDPAQGIARLHDAGSRGVCRRRTGGGRGGRPGCLRGRLGFADDRRRLRRTHRVANPLHHLGLRHHRRRLARLHFRRIEQEGVLAHQPAGRPVQFDEKVEEGFVDRLVRTDADDRRPPRTLVDNEAQIGQRRRKLDARLTEGVRRSEADGHAGQFIARSAQIEFGPQRLSERGKDGELAQTGSVSPHMQQRETGGHRQCGGAFF